MQETGKATQGSVRGKICTDKNYNKPKGVSSSVFSFFPQSIQMLDPRLQNSKRIFQRTTPSKGIQWISMEKFLNSVVSSFWPRSCLNWVSQREPPPQEKGNLPSATSVTCNFHITGFDAFLIWPKFFSRICFLFSQQRFPPRKILFCRLISLFCFITALQNFYRYFFTHNSDQFFPHNVTKG